MKNNLTKLKNSWRAAFVARGIFEAAGVLLLIMAGATLIFWYAIIARDQSFALAVSGILTVCAAAMFYTASMMEERGERLYNQYKVFEKLQTNESLKRTSTSNLNNVS